MHHVRNILLIFILSACSSGTPDTNPHTFRTYEENGIEVAETEGGSRYIGNLFQYELICELYEDEEIPESFIYQSYDFCIDETGNLYVADSGNCRIAIFGPDGAYQRSFGRRGDGPGEFQAVAIQALEGDTLSLWDYRSRRTTWYQTDGTLLDVLIPYHRIQARGLRKDADGLLYYSYHFGERQGDLQYGSYGVLITTADGDTISDIRPLNQLVFFSVQHAQGESGANPPFAGSSEVLLQRDGKILASTGLEPILQLFNREGDLVKEIRVGLNPEVISVSERHALQDSLRARANRSSSEFSRAVLRAFADNLHVPETRAFWSSVHQDDYGYYWLRYPNASIAYSEGPQVRYRILSPEGEYLGDTTTPTLITRVQFGKLLTYRTDTESGLSLPVVYRIQSTIQGFEYQ